VRLGEYGLISASRDGVSFTIVVRNEWLVKIDFCEASVTCGFEWPLYQQWGIFNNVHWYDLVIVGELAIHRLFSKDVIMRLLRKVMANTCASSRGNT